VSFETLTKWDPQMSWDYAEVDQLCWDPEGPQRFAVVPKLLTVLGICLLEWATLYQSFQGIERREVEERVTATGTTGASKAKHVETSAAITTAWVDK
jgi:hypothetical protein